VTWKSCGVVRMVAENNGAPNARAQSGSDNGIA